MPLVWICRECGVRFQDVADDDSCPACLIPLSHVIDHARQTDPLRGVDLTGPQRSIEAMMKRNRGCDLR